MDLNTSQENLNIFFGLFFNLTDQVRAYIKPIMLRYIKDIKVYVTSVDTNDFTIKADVIWRHKTTKYVHEINHVITIKYQEIGSICPNINDLSSMIASEIYFLLDLLQKTKCKVHCSKCVKRTCSRGIIIERYVHKFPGQNEKRRNKYATK